MTPRRHGTHRVVEHTATEDRDPKPPVNVRLPRELALELRVRSAVSGRPQCAIVADALRSYFAALDAADNEAR